MNSPFRAILLSAVVSTASFSEAAVTRLAVRPAAVPKIPAVPVQKCSLRRNIGLKNIVLENGLKVEIWYPTSAAAKPYTYTGEATAKYTSTLAVDAPLETSTCKDPLVIFSHGLGGCSEQSLFYTEALARAGFVVVAPNHKDADCGNTSWPVAEVSFSSPQLWSDQTYTDRRDDIEAVLAEFLSSKYSKAIDASRVGISGHSLGGYTAAAIAGAWDSWSDSRVKAALLFSPYVEPQIDAKTVGGLNTPVMYQGGTLDVGITPSVVVPGGAYDQSPAPKYFLELKKATHLAWSNVVCGSQKNVSKCLATSQNAQLIVQYGIAFLQQYVTGKSEPALKKGTKALAAYKFKIR